MTDKKETKSRVWIGGDGLINIEMHPGLTEHAVDDLFRQVIELIDQSGTEAKIIIDLTNSSLIHSSEFRKRNAHRIKELFEQSKFKKIALFGGNIMVKTTTSFILVASGATNIKMFNTREQAAKWLKRP